MSKGRPAPVTIFASLAILVILVYMVVAASGFRGLLPGSNLFKNKEYYGYYVFHRLLEELDYPVVFEKKYGIPGGTGETIVYMDMNETDDQSRSLLSEWVEKGNNLILFGDAIDTFFDADAVEYSGQKAALSGEFLTGLRGKKDISPAGATVQAGKGLFVLVPDGDPFTNGSLEEDGSNAYALDRLFYPYRTGNIYLREKASEAVFDPTLIKGLLKGRLSFITIHIILIFIVLLFVGGKRFSKPYEPEGKETRKITEHIRATGLFYQRAGASELIEKADAAYFRWVVCRNRKPSLLSEEEYLDYGTFREDLKEEEIMDRYGRRGKIISKLRRGSNGGKQ